MKQLRWAGWSLLLMNLLVLGSAPGSTRADNARTSNTGSSVAPEARPAAQEAPVAIHAAGRGNLCCRFDRSVTSAHGYLQT